MVPKMRPLKIRKPNNDINYIFTNTPSRNIEFSMLSDNYNIPLVLEKVLKTFDYNL